MAVELREETRERVEIVYSYNKWRVRVDGEFHSWYADRKDAETMKAALIKKLGA